jgi:type IV pilus assembly protein PilP
MKRNDLVQIFSYLAVGLLSVGAALSLSLHFLHRAGAQTNPAEATAPPAPDATAEPVAADATSAPAAPVAPKTPGIAELEGFLEPFIYDITNRRDPFQPYAEFVPSDNNVPLRALSPAQRFDLDQLKLIGIMWNVRDPKAMFLDPDKEVMILGRDESIGTHNGYIAAIREGEVVVVEALRKRGDIIYRTRVLRIER